MRRFAGGLMSHLLHEKYGKQVQQGAGQAVLGRFRNLDASRLSDGAAADGAVAAARVPGGISCFQKMAYCRGNALTLLHLREAFEVLVIAHALCSLMVFVEVGHSHSCI